MNDEVPTIKEELDRKTVENLVDLVSRLERGLVDERSAWVEAKTIWNVTCGLVSSDISEHAAQVANSINKEAWSRTFVHQSKMPVLMQILPNRAYVLTRITPETGERTRIAVKKFEPGEQPSTVTAAVNSLKAAGYIEI